MRLIDADEMHTFVQEKVAEGKDGWANGVPYEWAYTLTAINMQPTVDAVEVVRCKDCKHRGFAGECPMCYTEDAYDEDYGYDCWDVDKTVDEGFCHCGEKWDAEVQDGTKQH